MKKILLVSLLLLTACVSAEDKVLIQRMSDTAQNNLNNWGTKTDPQKEEALFNQGGAAALLDNHVNGTPIPEKFAKLVGEGK